MIAARTALTPGAAPTLDSDPNCTFPREYGAGVLAVPEVIRAMLVDCRRASTSVPAAIMDCPIGTWP